MPDVPRGRDADHDLFVNTHSFTNRVSRPASPNSRFTPQKEMDGKVVAMGIDKAAVAKEVFDVPGINFPKEIAGMVAEFFGWPQTRWIQGSCGPCGYFLLDAEVNQLYCHGVGFDLPDHMRGAVFLMWISASQKGLDGQQRILRSDVVRYIRPGNAKTLKQIRAEIDWSKDVVRSRAVATEESIFVDDESGHSTAWFSADFGLFRFALVPAMGMEDWRGMSFSFKPFVAK